LQQLLSETLSLALLGAQRTANHPCAGPGYELGQIWCCNMLELEEDLNSSRSVCIMHQQSVIRAGLFIWWVAAKLNQKGLVSIHLSLGTAAAAAETKWIPTNKLEPIRFRGAAMCCIPQLLYYVGQSQLHNAHLCCPESPLMTMVARTTSGGHYQAHVA